MEIRLPNGALEKLLALAGFFLMLVFGLSLLIHYHVVYAGFEPGEVVGEVTLSLDSLPTAGLELDKDALEEPTIAADSLKQEAETAAPEPVEEDVAEVEPEPIPEPEPMEQMHQEPVVEPEPIPDPPVAEMPPVELVQIPEPKPEIVVPEIIPVPQPVAMMPRPKPRPLPPVKKVEKPEKPKLISEPEVKKLVKKPVELDPVVPQDLASDGKSERNVEEKEGNSAKVSPLKTTDKAQSGKDQVNQKAKRVAAVSGAGRKAKGDYWQAVRARLNRYKKYPRAAERRKIRGNVTFSLTLTSDGAVTDFAIVDSSGSRILDRATKTMVSKASPFPPFPDNLEDAVMTKELSVEYKKPNT